MIKSTTTETSGPREMWIHIELEDGRHGVLWHHNNYYPDEMPPDGVEDTISFYESAEEAGDQCFWHETFCIQSNCCFLPPRVKGEGHIAIKKTDIFEGKNKTKIVITLDDDPQTKYCRIIEIFLPKDDGYIATYESEAEFKLGRHFDVADVPPPNEIGKILHDA